MELTKWLTAPPAAARDVVTLLARLGVGVVFLAHGWGKVEGGFSEVIAGFTKMGVPMPGLSALFATVVETAGGATLIVGLGVLLVGVLLFLNMMGAALLVHLEKGLYVKDGGYELVLVLGLSALLLAVIGAGRHSIDHLLTRRSAERTPGGRTPAGARR